VFPREAEETAFIKERCDLRLKNYLSIKHRALLLKSGTYPAPLFITVAVLAITATPTDEGTAKKRNGVCSCGSFACTRFEFGYSGHQVLGTSKGFR
jgi:hypothetical protein